MKVSNNLIALSSLKRQNYKITIRHWRKKLWRDKEEPLILDKSIRENKKQGGFGYQLVSEKGGATEIFLEKDDQVIAVRADCFHRDAFCKRVGVAECLKRLKTLHGIE